MSDSATNDNSYDIAIVGMSGRFPGARNLTEFWKNLRDGVESISFFSDEELLAAGVDKDSLSEPAYVKAGGSLADVELFDASFFGFNPREAEILDPQQRIFLECAWESLEDAGYDPETFEGSIGVYAGTSMSSYLYNLYSNPELVGLVGDFQVQLGNDKDNLPTSVSYKLNLKGPSIAIQTACSTSLVAVCVGAQSLLSYECDMALAGGVRVSLPQTTGYLYQDGGIMSPDGHCRAFDARARGTIGGNGIGIVVLKRLPDALADGDFIHAVIKGTAVNNDGSLKIGYTAPSIEGQAQVIATAQAVGNIDPRTITYIEAHGTGTDLGDPIEIAALSQAFHAGTEATGYCAIGSVKTNIGHLDTAAGVAGLIKAVLALKNKRIPPSLNFEEPNPQIHFETSPFYVNHKLSAWDSPDGPRRAGVNSFGIGGTNAHVVVEEAPPSESAAPSRPEQLVVLSARTPDALDNATLNLVEHLKAHPSVNLADAAYTLQVGRRAFDHRRILVSRDTHDAIVALEHLDSERVLTGRLERTARPVTFMFSGQGTQYVNMGRGLYRCEPGFREQIDKCCELLEPHLGFDLRRVLFPSDEEQDEAAQRLLQTAISQPALFVIEYGLAQLLIEWGVRPKVMIGHSLGEYVAACVAGVFSLEDALALVATRGRLMQEMPYGAMLAVALPEPDIGHYLNGKLSLAAVNGPSLCVVSGPTEAVVELETELTRKGLAGRRLHTSHAFHSEMMQPVLKAFTARMEGVQLKRPAIPYVSNVTGTWITSEEATDPNYWASHLRSTVRFGDGLAQLLSEEGILLEIGPGQTLCTLAKQQNGNAARHTLIATLRPAHDGEDDERFLLNALGHLWLCGVKIDWKGFHKHAKRLRTPLPTYPFERQRYWVEPQPEVNVVRTPQPPTLEKRPDIAEWFYLPSWRRTESPELLPRPTTEESQWLLFTDNCGVGGSLAERLKNAGRSVVSVGAGAEFARINENEYVINPREAADYATLLRELRALDRVPEAIVHLWSVTAGVVAAHPLRAFEGFQSAGFDSLFYLAQALGEETAAARLRLAIVTNQLQAVTGDELVEPSKGTLLGPCKVIPEEYPQIACQIIDIPLQDDTEQADRSTIDKLYAELNATSPDTVVAYRGKHRWVQAFDPIRLNEVPTATSPFREKGVYLITGGLGGIGLAIAEHLAKTVRARLVLVGRSDFPSRDVWGDWCATHDDSDPTSLRIRKLQEMEAGGAELILFTVDVADLDGMHQVVARINEQFGHINGVIHAAGVAGGRMIQLQSTSGAAAVMSPKTRGTLVLEAVLENQQMDFIVLCSSLNSIQGAFGQVDYCAANAFLDAYAQHRSSRGTKVVSINWDTWQEAGMAVDTVVPRDMEEMKAESLRQGITSAEGIEVLRRILNTNLTQVAVSTISLPALMARRDSDVTWSDEREEDSPAFENNQIYARPELISDYVAPRDEIEQTLATTWQDLLGIERVGIHDNFFELGGHSLLTVQIISRLRESFHIELSMRHFFEKPTIDQLATIIRQSQAKGHEEIDQLSQMLNLVEGLSQSEVERLLAGKELSEGDIST